MSASLRFLALVLVGWAGLRAATLGHVPGAELFRIDQGSAEPAPPEITQTHFPALEPLPFYADPAAIAPQAQPAVVPLPPYYRVPVPVIPAVAGVAAKPARFTEIVPVRGPDFYAPIPELDSWPLAEIARGLGGAPRRSTIAGDRQSIPDAVLKPKLDRLQLSAWALMRGKPGPDSLATGGTLGGSQAGARLTYNVNRWLAASLRTTSPVGNGARGAEIAAGVRVRPLASIPVAVTAERRQAIGSGGGRSAFALFAEGGVYQRPIALGFELDAYAQGGVVGFNSRDLFVDGGLTLTRPLFGRFSGGLGLWGGAQPGVYSIDAGPRLTMRMRNSMRLHLDWRQRLAGSAEPGSGPAVTLAADF